MRWVAFIMVCGLLLTTSIMVVRQDLHAPVQQTLKEPHARSYCRLLGPDNRLFYKLTPGTNRLKLRIRKKTEVPEQIIFSLNLLNQSQEAIDSTNLAISFDGQTDTRAEIQLDDQTHGVSTQRVRLLDLAAGPQGAILQLAVPSRNSPLWIRVLRFSKNRHTWRRMAAWAPMGQRPVIDMVLEKPYAQPDRVQGKQVLLKPNASTQKPKTIQMRMYRLGDVGIEIPIYELTGGSLRLKVRGSDIASQPTPVGLGYQILRGQEIISQGNLAASADSAALAKVKSTHAGSKRARSTQAFRPVSQEVTRYLHFGPQTTRLLLRSTSGASQSSFVQVAAWNGPFSGAGLRRQAPRRAPPGWTSIKPSNYSSLVRAKQVAWIEKPTLEPKPPNNTDHPRPKPEDYQSLRPRSQARSILLEPRTTASQPNDLVRIGPQGVSVCAHPLAKTNILIRLSDTKRLGQPLKIQLDGVELHSTRPLASSLLIPINTNWQDCHHLSIVGLQNDDIAFIDARLAPKSDSWARREVWQVNQHTPIQIPFLHSEPERITLSVYLPPDVRATLRLKVDGGRPKCRSGKLSFGYTRPVVERVIAPASKSKVLLLDRSDQALGIPQRIGLRVADDLRPGMHQLSIQIFGTKLAWVRASIRADRGLFIKDKQP